MEARLWADEAEREAQEMGDDGVPVRRHPDCDLAYCETCLADHTALARYLRRAVGFGPSVDALESYRSWLDRNGIPAETNGWASREAFSPKTVERFVEEMRSEF